MPPTLNLKMVHVPLTLSRFPFFMDLQLCSCFRRLSGCTCVMPLFHHVFPEAALAQLSRILWQLFFGGCAGAALTNFLAAVFLRLRRRSAHPFFGSCFPEAAQAQPSPIFWHLFTGGCVGAAFTICLCSCFREAAQAQLSPIFWQLLSRGSAGAALTIFWQLFSGGCAGTALTNFWQLFSGGCVGAALTNFLAAVSRTLRRRSSHQIFGSCFPEAAQAQLSPFLGSCLPEAAQALLSLIFRQLFVRDCAGAALTNFLAAVVRRLRRRSSHPCFGSCFPEAAQAQLSPIFSQLFS